MVETARVNFKLDHALKLAEEKDRLLAHREAEAKRVNWWRKWIFLRPYTEKDMCSGYVNWNCFTCPEHNATWYTFQDIEEACRISDRVCLSLPAYKMVMKYQKAP